MPTEDPSRKSVRHTIAFYEDSDDGRGALSDGDTVTVTGDRAKHAVRVKRVRAGDRVRLLLGAGRVALTTVEDPGRDLVLRVDEVWAEPAASPRIEVCSATPKGPRLEKMIDMLAQVGADAWRPMATKYGVVDPRENKLARAQRVADEAMQQCLRAHPMTVGEGVAFGDALDVEGGVRLVLADASGDAFDPACVVGASAVRVLVGPEGGFTDGEVEAAAGAGAALVNLGPHVLRIETAAVVLTSLVRNA